MTVTTVSIPRLAEIGSVPDRLYGGFVEHLGRSVYNGIYEPGHPTANELGFRQDIIDLIKELGVTTIRYPGGNFVSGFDWEDSVGPVEDRPQRLDLAWHSLEPNTVGIHEFQSWLDAVGSELMMAVNLGSRGMRDALNLLEYMNLDTPTSYASQRVENGRAEPFGVDMWCLGNELDGPWQLGHMSADEYGRLAAKTAAAMRQMQPHLELVAVGSSKPAMATFPEWEATVLDHTYELVDYISCHAYFELLDDDRASHIASGVAMSRYIETIASIIKFTRAKKRSNREVWISFDEWNIWANKRWHAVDKPENQKSWRYAPPILEDIYTRLDASTFGGLLISLLNNVDSVRAASLAQLVNVIAPIMTEVGGGAFRQSTFYPFSVASRYFRGVSLQAHIKSDTVDTVQHGAVPDIAMAATFNEDDNTLAVMYLNHDMDSHKALELAFPGFTIVESLESRMVEPGELDDVNSIEKPDRVRLVDNSSVEYTDASLDLEIPPATWGYLLLRVS